MLLLVSIASCPFAVLLKEKFGCRGEKVTSNLHVLFLYGVMAVHLQGFPGTEQEPPTLSVLYCLAGERETLQPPHYLMGSEGGEGCG